MKRNIKINKLLSFLLIMIMTGSLFTACSSQKSSTLSIIYTTDTHGHLISGEDTIGIDTIAAIKQDTPNSILVDAGDFMAGEPLASLTEGKDIITLMKSAQYDATAVGNHEFSYGLEVLQEQSKLAIELPNAFTMLAANVKDQNGNDLFTPWTIIELDGIRIGLFGLSTEETLTSIPTATAKQLSITNPIDAAKEAVESLNSQGCDIIVALSHIGSKSSEPTSLDIAKQVDGIDILIDGHSHVTFEEVPQENGTIMVSAGEYNQAIGILTFDINPNTDNITNISNKMLTAENAGNYTPAENVTTKLNEITTSQEAVLNEVIAHIEVTLEAEKPIVRTQETNFGNFVADVMVHASGADFGIINAGNIRANLSMGDITKGDMLTALPYDSLILTKSVTGSQLTAIIEHGLAELPEAEGQFLQISGLKFEADISQPAGQRLISIQTTEGEAILHEKQYTIATTEYIADGGDGFTVLGELPVLDYYEKQNDAVLDYLSEADMAQYAAGKAERIVITNQTLAP